MIIFCVTYSFKLVTRACALIEGHCDNINTQFILHFEEVEIYVLSFTVQIQSFTYTCFKFDSVFLALNF